MAQAPNIIGDQKSHKDVQKYGVTLHNMPVVAEALLTAKGSVLNDHVISGKRVGALVTIVKAGKPVLYQAAGEAPTDMWIAVTNGGADITPA
ncbi:hypothetical protein [Pseudomonas phage Alpheus]|uniref:Uncharacterized protein n=1 Tax=Pseudomonas phage Alpheus TaxID=2163983 RepID=A0A2S1GN01_9CAUD|nr:acetyl-CoA acetyltransferase [Pseudomonas phage Alpheus]AWD90767.1 hypothetical protein [Pseudomonas phage Alpheus]